MSTRAPDQQFFSIERMSDPEIDGLLCDPEPGTWGQAAFRLVGGPLCGRMTKVATVSLGGPVREPPDFIRVRDDDGQLHLYQWHGEMRSDDIHDVEEWYEHLGESHAAV